MIRSPEEIRARAAQRLNDFRTDLADFTSPQLFEKHILGSAPCVLTDVGLDRIFDIFTAQFGVDASAIHIVGSSVTGFSIKRERRWGWFDPNVSDIDVAVVDRELFDNYWQDVHEFSERGGGYWPNAAAFQQYLFDGWIRPDLMPGRFRNPLFDFFNGIAKTRAFVSVDVRAGFFSSDYFLAAYQCRAIDECKQI